MNVLRFSDLVAAGKVAGQRVFIRADLNVPQDDAGHITEDTRIRASLPCIRMALDAGAAVMVTSHLGRPTEGAFKPEDSLAPVAQRLGELLGREVPLVANWVDGVQVAPGQLVLLENCRVNKGEKKNDEALARKMAALCDIFVHDAFGTAHRAEATHLRHRAVRADRLRRPAAGGRDRRHHPGAGPSEAAAAGHRRRLQGQHQAEHPAKPGEQGRRPDRRRRHRQHLPAGRRACPSARAWPKPTLVDEAKAVIAAMKARGAAVPIPVDVVTAKEFKADAPATVKAVADVAADDLILDIGPKTAAMLAAQLKAAGTIVWNGPVGVFEFDAFAHGTETIARAIADSSAFSIAGGGDTLAAIAKYGIEKDVGYISTGGGAFLEVLEGKTLPAFEILAKRAAG